MRLLRTGLDRTSVQAGSRLPRPDRNGRGWIYAGRLVLHGTAESPASRAADQIERRTDAGQPSRWSRYLPQPRPGVDLRTAGWRTVAARGGERGAGPATTADQPDTRGAGPDRPPPHIRWAD